MWFVDTRTCSVVTISIYVSKSSLQLTWVHKSNNVSLVPRSSPGQYSLLQVINNWSRKRPGSRGYYKLPLEETPSNPDLLLTRRCGLIPKLSSVQKCTGSHPKLGQWEGLGTRQVQSPSDITPQHITHAQHLNCVLHNIVFMYHFTLCMLFTQWHFPWPLSSTFPSHISKHVHTAGLMSTHVMRTATSCKLIREKLFRSTFWGLYIMKIRVFFLIW